MKTGLQICALLFSIILFTNVQAEDVLQLEMINPTTIQSNDDVISDIPVNFLLPGHYLTEYGYFADVLVSNWANRYQVEGLARYGNYNFRFEAQLEQSFNNSFVGRNGQIEIRYSNGMICYYPIEVTIFAYAASLNQLNLFIESVMPSWVPTTITNFCRLAGPLTNYHHPRPYVYSGL